MTTISHRFGQDSARGLRIRGGRIILVSLAARARQRHTDSFYKREVFLMQTTKLRNAASRAGKIKYGLVAWLIGLPLPVIILALFWGGCDF
jgi:hypothetical protein